MLTELSRRRREFISTIRFLLIRVEWSNTLPGGVNGSPATILRAHEELSVAPTQPPCGRNKVVFSIQDSEFVLQTRTSVYGTSGAVALDLCATTKGVRSMVIVLARH